MATRDSQECVSFPQVYCNHNEKVNTRRKGGEEKGKEMVISLFSSSSILNGKKKRCRWCYVLRACPYLEFLASCSVAEHHPQGTAGIEPRDGALAAAQVHWLNSAM